MTSKYRWCENGRADYVLLALTVLQNRASPSKITIFLPDRMFLNLRYGRIQCKMLGSAHVIRKDHDSCISWWQLMVLLTGYPAVNMCSTYPINWGIT